MSYIAWHFASDDYAMNFDDGRKLEVGKTYRTIWPCNGHDKPTLCKAGMHGSLKAIDALKYAPGPVVCLTEIYGNVVIGEDKIVGESRKILKMVNAEETLKHFARLCALDVVHLWNAPRVVIDYLNTGDESLRDTAKAAAKAAAWDAVSKNAVWAADWAAAKNVVRAAWDAMVAAWAADRVAAKAVRAAQNERLESMLMDAFK